MISSGSPQKPPNIFSNKWPRRRNLSKNGDLTGQKENQKNRETVSDQDLIAFAVGMAQILEHYAKCSLDVQNIKLHPTSAPGILRELEKSLEELLQ